MDSSCGVVTGPGAPYGAPCGRTVTYGPIAFAAASSARFRRPVMATTLPANVRKLSSSTRSTSHQSLDAQETRDEAEGAPGREALTPGDRGLIRRHDLRPFRGSSRGVRRRQHLHQGRDGLVAAPYLAAAEPMDDGGHGVLVVDGHRTHGLDDIKPREIVRSGPVNGLLGTRVSGVACAAPMTQGGPWPPRRAAGPHSSWTPAARGALQGHAGGTMAVGRIARAPSRSRPSLAHLVGPSHAAWPSPSAGNKASKSLSPSRQRRWGPTVSTAAGA